MLRTFWARARRLRFRSLQRGDLADGTDHPLENVDALAAVRGDDIDPLSASGRGAPPGWVKLYDEGRPPK